MIQKSLKQIIVEKVFDNKKIKEISDASDLSLKRDNWVMNFKSVSIEKEFLDLFCEAFNERYQGRVFQVGGMESGAIPMIAALSLRSSIVKSSFYVRKSRKKHDLANSYEGQIQKDTPIILVDDILNKGGTFLKVIAVLEAEGFRVSEVFTVLRFRDVSYYKELTDKGVKVSSIFELNDFKDSLNLENFGNSKSGLKKVLFDKYKQVWGVALAKEKSNLYLVIPKSGICHDEDCIYTGSDSGTFYCLNKKDGTVKWSYMIRFGVSGKTIFSTPCLSEECVFFGAYDGNLYCLNKETGKIIWVFFDADYVGASPWVENNEYVYIGLEFGLLKKKGGVAKVAIKTGKLVWGNYEMFGLTHASPVSNIKLDVVVCGCNDGFIYCFERKTGVLRWKYKTEGEVKYGCVFDEIRGIVVIAGMDGCVYCINTKDGTLWHKFEAIFGFYSTPTLDKNCIYIGSLDKRIYCFDMNSKTKKWEILTAGRVFASPVLFKDVLYVGSNDGNLYEVQKEDGVILSRTIISERIVNKIIVTEEAGNKNLYIKSFTNELYKFIQK